MSKKFLVVCLVFSVLVVCGYCILAFAQEAGKEEQPAEAQEPMMPVIPPEQRTFGTVGEVEYVDFKAKEPAIVVKDQAGNKTQVTLDEIKADAMLLVTYRKVKDAKGKEKNSLISLSLVKPAEAPKAFGGKK